MLQTFAWLRWRDLYRLDVCSLLSLLFPPTSVSYHQIVKNIAYMPNIECFEALYKLVHFSFQSLDFLSFATAAVPLKILHFLSALGRNRDARGAPRFHLSANWISVTPGRHCCNLRLFTTLLFNQRARTYTSGHLMRANCTG